MNHGDRHDDRSEPSGTPLGDDPHVPRTDIQAVVQGTFVEEVLGLRRVTDELDRIAALMRDLADTPVNEVSDASAAEIDRLIRQLATDLNLSWPWATRELHAGLRVRRDLVQVSRQDSAGNDAKNSGLSRELFGPMISGWPPKRTYDRRRAAGGGGPWAVVDQVLAPRLVVKRGDALSDVQRRWDEITERVEQHLRSSLFSIYLDEGPPSRAAKDDVAAYERYARWAAWHLVGGVSYRQIAREEYKHARGPSGIASDARDRWRDISRGVAKARKVLDSI